LRLQLKLLAMEKLIGLDLEIQNQEGKNTLMNPFPASPSSVRASMSVFSKPRKHISGLPSPDSSPRLIPSPSNLSLPSTPSMRFEIPTVRRAGYQLSPITPSERRSGLPKIVHLGPASFSPLSSPVIGAEGPGRFSSGVRGDVEAKTTRIKSSALIQATFRRIRGVQTFMGYNLLLPLPGMNGDVPKDEDAALQAWTKQQALAAIQKEMTALLEEFKGSFGLDEDIVIVELEPTL